MIITLIVTCVKIVVASLGKHIKDGVLIVYVTDIVIEYFKSMVVFVDIMMGLILIVSLATNNDHEALGIALYITALIKLFTMYENLKLIETTFVNSFKK